MTGKDSPARLHPGDRVRIIIEPATVAWDDGKGGDLFVTYPTNLGTVETKLTRDSAAVTVERLTPDFGHNEAWADRDGLVWVAQAVDDDQRDIRLHSSLGSISLDEAARYAPWTRVYAPPAPPEPTEGTPVVIRSFPAVPLTGVPTGHLATEDDERPAAIRPKAWGPLSYLGVPMTRTLRPNWNTPEANWWRQGVKEALAAVGAGTTSTPSVDDPDDPRIWHDGHGNIWGLPKPYTDRNGDRWHWTGGLTYISNRPLPLFTRADWATEALPLDEAVEHYGPFTVEPRKDGTR